MTIEIYDKEPGVPAITACCHKFITFLATGKIVGRMNIDSGGIYSWEFYTCEGFVLSSQAFRFCPYCGTEIGDGRPEEEA